MPTRTGAALVIAAASWLCATSAFAADLSLESVAVRVRTDDRTARTELRLVVRNHTEDWQEAYIYLDLPANAVVTGMSMDVGTGANRPRMEGRIADRDRAAEVYQAIVDSVRDPALLEDQGDGRYQLRVFPVPGDDTKTVDLQYEHRLPQRGTLAHYVFEPPRLLDGPERIDSFSLSVDGDTRHRGVWSTSRPVRVALERDAIDPLTVTYARHAGRTYFRAELVPEPSSELRTYGGVVLAVDTSRTMNDDYAAAVAHAQRIYAAMRDTAEVRVVRGDSSAAACDDMSCITAAEPAGASDLGALLELAARQADSLPSPVAIVVVGDGRHAVGDGEDQLVAIAAELSGEHTLHVVAAGDARHRFLDRLARAGRGHLTYDAAELLALLPVPRIHALSVEAGYGRADGLGWLGGPVAAGEPIALYGRLVTAHAEIALSGLVAGDSYDKTIALERPRRVRRNRGVVRGWMRAAPPEATAQVRGVDAVTAAHALIVLETEAEYAQLEGAASGGVAGRRVVTAPRVRIGNSVAVGDLDKNILRRYIRRHRKRVRHCYNRALVRDPSAEGTVRVRWSIDPDGRSRDVSVVGDIDDDQLEACIARVHRSIRFPTATGRGWINVTYPYSFVPPSRYNTRLSVADEGELLAHAVRAGKHKEAAASLAEIEAQLSGKPPRALLPYLAAPSVRAHFGARFRRAAFDRLAQPNPPTELWTAVALSIAADAPDTIEDAIGSRELSTSAAASVLHALLAKRHTDAARAVARAWVRGPMSDRDLYDVLAGDETLQLALPVRWFLVALRAVDSTDPPEHALDHFIAAAKEVGMDRLAADRVLARCEQDSEPCRRWLSAQLDDPRLDARLTALLSARVEVLLAARSGAGEITELASLLEWLDRDAEAARVHSELSDLRSAAR